MGSRAGSTSGFGDLTLMPVALGWHAADWYSNFALSVIAPTGQYDPNKAVNLSAHYWAVDSSYSVSYLTQTGLDLSVSAGYTVNFENPATHYRSGDVAHVDLALGHNLTRAFKIGAGAYAIVQVTGDSGSGARLGPFKSDIYGAGPAFDYTRTLGSIEFDVQLRGYREFGAQNHLTGTAAYLTVAFKL